MLSEIVVDWFCSDCKSTVDYAMCTKNKLVRNLNDLKHCSICTNINVNKLLTNLLKYWLLQPCSYNVGATEKSVANIFMGGGLYV